MSTEKKSSGMLDNLKFNTVGREEAATEVLHQQIDSATMTRNIIIGVVAALVLGGIVYAGFKKTGADIWAKPVDSRPLQAPEHNVNGI